VINWTQVEALTAVTVVAGTTAGHFTDRFRTRNRIEDAIFGYPGEPGILERLRTLENRLR
jgi:hypothetical protein